MRGFHSRFFILSTLILLLCCACCVAAFYRGGISPVRQTAAFLVTPVQRGILRAGMKLEEITHYVEYNRKLEAENAALRAQIADYQSRVREADLLLSENDALRDLLSLNRRYRDLTLQPGTVLAWETGQEGQIGILDCGAAEGITSGNGVLTAEGIVGVVIETEDHWCRMHTIQHPDFQAAVRITRSGESAVAAGNGANLTLSYLPGESHSRIGDRVVTSGLGGRFPSNLLLGHIRSLQTEEHGLSASGTLRPAADTKELRQVFIITDFEVTE